MENSAKIENHFSGDETRKNSMAQSQAGQDAYTKINWLVLLKIVFFLLNIN
jgi:hypothetical protein